MMGGQLLSWGRYPPQPQQAHVVSWRDELPARFAAIASRYGTLLPFGNGRSYGDSCLAHSGQVVHMRGLDKLLSVDWEKGIVCAEAGVTLDELLQVAIPRGWFLPVTPGTKFVTLGGAVANDVHGKNHHVRGTFGCHVRRFALLRSSGELLICSPENHADLFAATIGGLGLTGIVVWVEIALMPVRSSQMNTVVQRFGSLQEFFDLSLELDARHEYTVSWVDCLAGAGRGVFIAGDHAEEGPLDVVRRTKLSVPITPPISAVNQFSLRLFNALYYRAQPGERTRAITSYEPYFYPLDRILHWNRMYGRRGFQQYQCVIPTTNAKPAMSDLLKIISGSGQGSFLAVLKCCGEKTSPGWLSFPLPGVSLALDFPQSEALGAELFPHLDRLVRESGGRLYPAKDAHMSGEDFRHFYPRWAELESIRDPALCSRFWQRVCKE